MDSNACMKITTSQRTKDSEVFLQIYWLSVNKKMTFKQIVCITEVAKTPLRIFLFKKAVTCSPFKFDRIDLLVLFSEGKSTLENKT